MARDFDGVDDIITVPTFPMPGSGAFSIGAWVYARTVGEGTQAIMVRLEASGAFRFKLFRLFGSGTLNISLGGSVATLDSGQAVSLNTWTCVIATYDGSGNASGIGGFVGTPASAMTALTGTPSGTIGTLYDATDFYVGNRSSTAETWDGLIERPFFVPWKMTRDEAERFRLGDVSTLYDHGAPTVFLPLTSPTSSQAEDLSGNAKPGTVTGCLTGEGPPVPFSWGEIGSA